MGDKKAKLYSLLKHWLISHEIFEKDKKYIKKLYLLRYEDFVNDPNQCLRRIYLFLGLDNHTVKIKIYPDINADFLDRWKKDEQNLLKKYYIAFLKSKFESRINRFGYSLNDLALH